MNEEEVKNELATLRERSHDQANTLQSQGLKIALLESTVKEVLMEQLGKIEKNITTWREKHDKDAETRHAETIRAFDKLYCVKGEICPLGNEKNKSLIENINEKNKSLNDRINWLWGAIIALLAIITGVAFKKQ